MWVQSLVEDWMSVKGVRLGVGGMITFPICYSERTESLSNSNKHLAGHAAAAITQKRFNMSWWMGQVCKCVAGLKGSANVAVRWEDNSCERERKWEKERQRDGCLFMCRGKDAVSLMLFFFPKRCPVWGTGSPKLVSEVGFVSGLQPTQSTTVCLPGFWLCV